MMIKLQSLLKSIRHNQERKAFACLSYLKPTLQWDPSSYYSGRQQQNGSQRNEVHFSVTKLCTYWYNSYVTKINENIWVTSIFEISVGWSWKICCYQITISLIQYPMLIDRSTDLWKLAWWCVEASIANHCECNDAVRKWHLLMVLQKQTT